MAATTAKMTSKGLFIPEKAPARGGGGGGEEYWTLVDGSYAVVSHVWGAVASRADPRNVVNRGSTLAFSDRKLRCLWAAVDRLGSAKTRGMWCDVLCIDQDSVADKNAQVSIMDRIYEHAAVCYAVLSDADAAVFAPLLRYALHFGGDGSSKLVWEKCTCKPSGPAQGTPAKPLELQWCGSIVCKTLRGADEMDYFSRAWTFQECVLSRDIVFVDEDLRVLGSASALKSAFTTLQRRMDEAEKSGAATSLQVEEAREILRQVQVAEYLGLGKVGLATIPPAERVRRILNSGERRCSVAHDIVYSRFKLLLDVEVPIDYAQPIEAVVRTFLFNLFVAGFVYLRPAADTTRSDWVDIPGASWLGSVFVSREKGPFSTRQICPLLPKPNLVPVVPRTAVAMEPNGNLRLLEAPAATAWLVAIDDYKEVVRFQVADEQPGEEPTGETNYSAELVWGSRRWVSKHPPFNLSHGKMAVVLVGRDQMVLVKADTRELLMLFTREDEVVDGGGASGGDNESDDEWVDQGGDDADPEDNGDDQGNEEQDDDGGDGSDDDLGAEDGEAAVNDDTAGGQEGKSEAAWNEELSGLTKRVFTLTIHEEVGDGKDT